MGEFSDERAVRLPAPDLAGGRPLNETVAKRGSVRNFLQKKLTAAQISQLLWSAQGITRPWGGRTAPSAGALFPLELYVALPEGVFHYGPGAHELRRLSGADVRERLAQAALGQTAVRTAPVVIVIAAVYERTERKYGGRAERYVKIEVGHASQNILLEAVALGLGAVPVGAFYDDRVQDVLSLPADHRPLYLIPVGHPAK